MRVVLFSVDPKQSVAVSESQRVVSRVVQMDTMINHGA